MPRTSEMWSHGDSTRLFTILNDLKQSGNGTNWKKIMEIYNSQSTITRSVKQGRNHVFCCQSKYKAYVALHKMEGVAFNEDGLPFEEELQHDSIQTFIQNTTHGSFVTKNKLPDLSLWEMYFGGRSIHGSQKSTVTPWKRKGTESSTGHDFENISGQSNSDSWLKSNQLTYTLDEYEESGQKKRSIGSCSLGNLKIRGDERSERNALNIEELTQPNDSYVHTDKLYLAVTGMDMVKQRGNAFAARAIKYLIAENLDKSFVRFESDEMRWEWLKDLQ